MGELDANGGTRGSRKEGMSRTLLTADVAIRYSSPDGLPFSFEWTATVKTDGSVTTTPLQYTGPDTL